MARLLNTQQQRQEELVGEQRRGPCSAVAESDGLTRRRAAAAVRAADDSGGGPGGTDNLSEGAVGGASGGALDSADGGKFLGIRQRHEKEHQMTIPTAGLHALRWSSCLLAPVVRAAEEQQTLGAARAGRQLQPREAQGGSALHPMMGVHRG